MSQNRSPPRENKSEKEWETYKRSVGAGFIFGGAYLACSLLVIFADSILALLGIVVLAFCFLVWARKQKDEEWLGPLFYYDLVNMARRGRVIWLRFGYGLFLLVGLYLTYPHRFPVHLALTGAFGSGPQIEPAKLARFAGTLATALYTLQTVAILAITPAYVAGALAEEKERGTLDLLVTSQLTEREIVVGKMVGRLAQLACVLLTALPAFVMLQWWGGVEPLLPFCGFAFTLTTLFLIGSICMRCSARCATSVRAIVLSYSIVVPIGAISFATPYSSVFSPIAGLPNLEGRIGAGDFHEILWGENSVHLETNLNARGLHVLMPLLNSIIFPFVAANGFIADAVRRLRGTGKRGYPPNRVDEEMLARLRRKHWEQTRKPIGKVLGGWDPVEQTEKPAPAQRKPRRTCHPVTDSPLYWKEVHHGALELLDRPFWKVYLKSLALTLPLALLMQASSIYDRFQALRRVTQADSSIVFSTSFWLATQNLNGIVRFAVLITAPIFCLTIAWQAAPSISLEREQRTLDSLLALPVERVAILRAKWWGSIARARSLFAMFAVVLTVGALLAGLHPGAAALTLAATIIYAAFLASLGVFLSLWCRSTLRANLAMAAILGLVIFGTAAVSAYRPLFFGTRAVGWWDGFIRFGLNPPRAWQYLPMQWYEFKIEVFGNPGIRHGKLGAALAGLGVYAFLAGVFWLAARRRFQRV